MAKLSDPNVIQTDELDFNFDLYLFGGYLDERNLSEELAIYLLTQFARLARHSITLATAFIGRLNTKSIRISGTIRSPLDIVVPAPIVYGAAIHVRTGRLFNARLNRQHQQQNLSTGSSLNHLKISNIIPLYDIRRAAVTYGQARRYKEIYDPVKRLLEIQPPTFDPDVSSVEALAYFQYALRLKDQIILKVWSL